MLVSLSHENGVALLRNFFFKNTNFCENFQCLLANQTPLNVANNDG